MSDNEPEDYFRNDPELEQSFQDFFDAWDETPAEVRIALMSALAPNQVPVELVNVVMQDEPTMNDLEVAQEYILSRIENKK